MAFLHARTTWPATQGPMMAGLLLAGALAAAGCRQAADTRPPASAPFAPTATQPTRHILDSRAEYVGPGGEGPEPAGLTEVRLGWFGPQDPPDGVGRNLWRGAVLAVEEANRAGGYHGRPFRLVARWSTDPWGDGARQASELIYGDRVWAVLGSIDGAATHIAEQLATRARVAVISPIASDAGLTQAGVPWIFRCAPDDLHQARVLARLLEGARPAALAVVSATDHDSRAGVDVLIRHALPGVRLTAKWQLNIDVKQENYSPQIDRLRDYGADAVVLWAPSAAAARFLKQLREHGGQQRVLGPVVLASDDFLRAAGPAAEGVMTVLTREPSAEVAPVGGGGEGVKTRPAALPAQFEVAFRARFGEIPDYVAASGYDAAGLLIAGVRQSGLNRVRIREALAGLSGYAGATGTIRWDNGGGNVREPLPAVVRDGRVHRLATSHDH